MCVSSVRKVAVDAGRPYQLPQSDLPPPPHGSYTVSAESGLPPPTHTRIWKPRYGLPHVIMSPC